MGKTKDVILQLSGLYKIYGKKLETEIKAGDIPNHIALILDGNRRWAKRNLEINEKGHWQGADAVENLLDWCEEFNIKIVTLYALSAENLDRKDNELEDLYELIRMRLEKLYNDPRIHRCEMRVKGIGRMELLPESIREVLTRLDDVTKNYKNRFLNIALAYGGQYELVDLYELIRMRLEKLYNDPRIHRCEMRVKGIGRIELLPESIREVLTRLDNVTKNYNNHFLNIALAYGGQYELVDAVKKIGEKIKEGKLQIEDITKEEIESNLYTSHLPQPSPDMILRTSGEKRLSGFLIWQSAYSELVFMDIFWPEFRKIDLMRAIRTFQERKRRLGK